MDKLIRDKDIKLLLLKLDVSKSMGPDEIHPNIKVLFMQYVNCLKNV